MVFATASADGDDGGDEDSDEGCDDGGDKGEDDGNDSDDGRREGTRDTEATRRELPHVAETSTGRQAEALEAAQVAGDQDEQGGPPCAWVCFPRVGRHAAFAGNLLHGVPAEVLPLMQTGSSLEQYKLVFEITNQLLYVR